MPHFGPIRIAAETALEPSHSEVQTPNVKLAENESRLVAP